MACNHGYTVAIGESLSFSIWLKSVSDIPTNNNIGLVIDDTVDVKMRLYTHSGKCVQDLVVTPYSDQTTMAGWCNVVGITDLLDVGSYFINLELTIATFTRKVTACLVEVKG